MFHSQLLEIIVCYYYLYNSFFFLAWNYNPKIINGEDAKEGEIPYQVSYFIIDITKKEK